MSTWFSCSSWYCMDGIRDLYFYIKRVPPSFFLVGSKVESILAYCVCDLIGS
jgi:hypothetical protein